MKRRVARLVKWLGWIAGAAGVAIFGSYLAMAAWIKFGGAEVEAFCHRDWVGSSGDAVAEQARAAGLVVRRQPGLVRVKDNPRLSGHACDAMLVDGRVTRTRSTFLF